MPDLREILRQIIPDTQGITDGQLWRICANEYISVARSCKFYPKTDGFSTDDAVIDEMTQERGFLITHLGWQFGDVMSLRANQNDPSRILPQELINRVIDASEPGDESAGVAAVNATMLWLRPPVVNSNSGAYFQPVYDPANFRGTLIVNYALAPCLPIYDGGDFPPFDIPDAIWQRHEPKLMTCFMSKVPRMQRQDQKYPYEAEAIKMRGYMLAMNRGTFFPSIRSPLAGLPL